MNNSKRIISLLLSVIMIMSVFSIVPFTAGAVEAEAAATAETEGDYKYDVLYDGTAEITKYTGEGGDVTIPSSLGGYIVTSIGAWAFEGLTSLTSIDIPDSVTSIGYEAFYRCSSLTSVTIPDSVTSIGGPAFEDCTGLTSVVIPDSVTSIDYGAFSGCTGLMS
ncbi:MAG: leucine-rich repeat domain-containing protein, partial [Ruminococcus sp.]|nr:leucine-rich repeat domain-containing protein [Ruminococcus sp.]